MSIDQQDKMVTWKKWKERCDAGSSIIAAQFLRKVCQDYQSELTRVKTDYNESEDRLYKENCKKLKDIDDAAKQKSDAAKISYDAALRDVDRMLKKYLDTYGADLEAVLEQNARANGLKGLMQRLLVPNAYPAKEREQVSTQQSELKYLCTLERVQLKDLYDKQLATIRAEADRERENEASRYNTAREYMRNAYNATVSSLEKKYRALLNDVMSEDDIRHYIEKAHSSVHSSGNYVCAQTLPDDIYFGDIYMDIAKRNDLYEENSTLICECAQRALEKDSGSVIRAKLPYSQRLKDGISLLVSYSEAEREYYNKRLGLLMLRLFMSFPAGNFEAVMIDPLERGGTFSMFTKLGEEKSRIIDERVWSDESDIEQHIRILLDKIDSLTLAYGSNMSRRYERMPVYALAIADFPVGFSAKALHDLQAIVRKSAEIGICVFIFADSRELAKLQSSQQSVFAEMKNMLNNATASGRMLLLENERYMGAKLMLDSMDEEEANMTDIIDTLTAGIHNARMTTVYFEDMFEDISDPNSWHSGSTLSEISIPIGVKGADYVVKMSMGKSGSSTEHHALVAGMSGSGKSTLLHTIIISTLLTYSPDEAQLYLVDFKEGVEFKSYSRFNLPSIKAVVVDCEREFALSILKELDREMKNRLDTFERMNGQKDIESYRRATGKSVPRLLMIIDEVQDLFRGENDDMTKECSILMAKLLEKGRAAGIHFIIVSQSFDQIPDVKNVFLSNCAIRVAINGAEDSAKSVLGADNTGYRQLHYGDVGAAIYNNESGSKSANTVFQIAYLKGDVREQYIKNLSELFGTEAFRRIYTGKTRVLLTSAEDDRENAFNRLILDNQVDTLEPGESRYSLNIGSSLNFMRKFTIGLDSSPCSNILMIGRNEHRAAAMCSFIMLSLLYDELTNTEARKDNQLIHLVDLSSEDVSITPEETDFEYLSALFHKQIKRERKVGMHELIKSAYELLHRRLDSGESCTERLFLVLFGADRLGYSLSFNMNRQDTHASEISDQRMLRDIFKYGPGCGINSIVWGESVPGLTKSLGAGVELDFAQRIAFETDSETYEALVGETESEQFKATTAVYMNVSTDVKNTHFRPYEVPVKVWVKKIAQVYRTLEEVRS